ncbi:RNA polymerase sigma factor [Yoonia sp. 208BN28-4]|uniref:RNA polymerase sigma factor n=1 Tax=Yoonia sp. 208BN28-4 TaxID=3126505 RepID=UPI0030B0EC16
MIAPPTARQAIATVVQEEWGRILAALVKSLGDFQLAEDCLQDAVAKALAVWPENGLPDVPAAWLITTARRRALDIVRRDARFAKRVPELSHLADMANTAPDHEVADMIPDKRLEMIFTCCHPALDEKTRVALTLRTLGGLSTNTIAAAFLDQPDAMAQRLVRAKHKIASAGIPYVIPDKTALPDRIAGVLSVIYLIFNAGYTAANAGKSGLSDEAIRLGRIIHQLLPEDCETAGLLALMLLHDARRAARLDAQGRMVPLSDQNRHRWDRAKIAEGDALLKSVLPKGNVGPYQLQAAISAVHTTAPSWNATDWPQIVALYDLLYQVTPTPVVQINRAMAVSQINGPQAGLALLDDLAGTIQLERYQSYHSARADLLERAGHLSAACHSYDAAIALTEQEVERAFLTAKRARISH